MSTGHLKKKGKHNDEVSIDVVFELSALIYTCIFLRFPTCGE